MSENKPDYYTYPAVFTYHVDGQITVFFPDLDVATVGNDDAHALGMARECLGLAMNGLEDDKTEIPIPTPLSQIEVGENERSALIDVYMPSVRLRCVNRAVKRTVTLPAWLNAKSMENNINFSQVLQEALKKQLGCD